MLEPPKAALSAGVMVELEGGGGYYRQPPTPPAELTPEQRAIKDETTALYMLDHACKTEGVITNMSKRLHTIYTREGYDSNPTEVRRLEDAVANSNENYWGFRRSAKAAFAQSIGIETEVVKEEVVIEGTPRHVLVVRAKRDDQQAELTRHYGRFYSEFGDSSSQEVREQRRRELLASIGEKPDPRDE